MTVEVVEVVEAEVQVVEITSGTVEVVGVAEAVGPRGPAGSNADDIPTLRYIFENGLI